MNVPPNGWSPRPAVAAGAGARERSRIGRYLSWLDTERGLAFADYDELWRWSISDLDGFWSSVWEYHVSGGPAPRPVLAERTMPGARLVPHRPGQLAAERLLAAWTDRPTEVALVAYGQHPPDRGRRRCVGASRGGCERRSWPEASARATACTCRTSPRRSSPSWPAPASVRSGARAPPSSAAQRDRSLLAGRAEGARPSPATATATSWSTAGPEWPRCSTHCRRSSS